MLDGKNRVLLFEGHDPSQPIKRFWFPPGGGIEDGETAEQAARREVFEETGLAAFELGPHNWNRRHAFTFEGKDYDLHETWLFARVSAFEIDTTNFTDVEKRMVRQHRWWTPEELHKTTELLTPRQLPLLLKHLLDDGLPLAPITVPV